jgi:hypothetical protein
MAHRPNARLSALVCGAGMFALAGLTACGSAPSPGPSPDAATTRAPAGLPAVLVQRVDSAYEKAGRPSSDVPELDSDASCPLEVSMRIAGAEVEQFGAGVSTIGDTGHRVVCEGTDPSITLSVGHLTSGPELTELQDNAGPQQEAGNEQTGSTETVGNRRFTVVRTTYPTNDSHIDYTVTLTDPAELAYAVLQVETTDDARETYSSNQAARDLAAMLDSTG